MFIDEYECPNIVKDWRVFLKIMSNLKPYLVELDLEKNIKNKIYSDDYQIGDINC